MRRNLTYCIYHASKASKVFPVSALSRYPSVNDISKRHKFSLVLPHKTTPVKGVPDHIQKPPYAFTGVVGPKPLDIDIKTEEQIAVMRDTCQLARKILDSAGRHLKVGVTTDEIDELVHQMCIDNGAYPSPLMYNHFPKSICTSVNNVACHGIPDLRPLEEGDIINVDITHKKTHMTTGLFMILLLQSAEKCWKTIYKNGVHGDVSKTYLIGAVDEKVRQLVEVTEKCLYTGIAQCRPGQKFLAIGTAIRDLAKANGFSVIPAFCGHGIGHEFHTPPDIVHIPLDGCESQHVTMKEGMTFTIEPILSEGTDMIAILEDDGWTALSEDGSRSAQFEHTVLITSGGCEILTISEEELKRERKKKDA